jgi:hypothetical protein
MDKKAAEQVTKLVTNEEIVAVGDKDPEGDPSRIVSPTETRAARNEANLDLES